LYFGRQPAPALVVLRHWMYPTALVCTLDPHAV
jgi:hypothetical protein